MACRTWGKILAPLKAAGGLPGTSVGPGFYLRSLQAAVLLIKQHKNTTVNFLTSTYGILLVLPTSDGFAPKPETRSKEAGK